MINVALVGVGYWGPNLARNFSLLEKANLYAICDLDQSRLDLISKTHPTAKTTKRFSRLLKDPNIEAISIATPALSHFSLAKQSLLAGKHVLAEKPLAMTTKECKILTNLAKKKALILMVDHIFLYNDAAIKLKEYIKNGKLGKIYYISSSRLNLGIVRNDVNALWNFAPHDFSLLLYLLEKEPLKIITTGQSFLQKGIEDIIFVHLDFPQKITAHVQISWLNPAKERRMIVVGSKKMAVWDDVSSTARIQLYDSSVAKAKKKITLGKFGTYGEFHYLTQSGDILTPKIGFTEPLKRLCGHFIDCILKKKTPVTDGRHGTKVIKMLEIAQQSLDQGGMPVKVNGL